jgi:hypothetical protein
MSGACRGGEPAVARRPCRIHRAARQSTALRTPPCGSVCRALRLIPGKLRQHAQRFIDRSGVGKEFGHVWIELHDVRAVRNTRRIFTANCVRKIVLIPHTVVFVVTRSTAYMSSARGGRGSLTIRMALPRSVCITTWAPMRRPKSLTPIVTKRSSSSEWPGSNIVRECGSAKIVVASSNDTRCFTRFACALPSFHSN